MRDLYYSKGLEVWKSPVRTIVDGGVSVSLGFHACTASDVIGEEGAVAIATLLSLAEAAQTPSNGLKHPQYAHGISDAELVKEAITFCDDELDGYSGMEYDDDCEVACQRSNTFIRELVRRLELSVSTAPAPHVAGIEDGIERAARYIEKQRDDYVQEFGNYDPSTGVTEFSTAGEEHLSKLEELIDGIRALHEQASPPAPQVPVIPAVGSRADLVRCLSNITRLYVDLVGHETSYSREARTALAATEGSDNVR